MVKTTFKHRLQCQILTNNKSIECYIDFVWRKNKNQTNKNKNQTLMWKKKTNFDIAFEADKFKKTLIIDYLFLMTPNLLAST